MSYSGLFFLPILVTLTGCTSLCAPYYPKATLPAVPSFALPRLVAHAGGGIDGQTYTNSLEALENSAKNKFHLFEMDVSLTSDRQLVLIHDWEYVIKTHFEQPVGIRTLKEFQKLKFKNGLSPLDFSGLVQWLNAHPDAYVVTDTKEHNVEVLRLIKDRYPQVVGKIIPQIYFFEEYEPVKKLGYEQIILTMYLNNYSDEQIIEFSRSHPLLALCASIRRANPGFIQKVKEMGPPLYVHTVNERAQYQQLLSKGVHGVYTDFLTP